jgi:hypothetical protein
MNPLCDTMNDTDVLSSRLVSVLPRLRRWGFRLTQHPQAAQQPYERQRERSLIAACYLLDIAPVPENFDLESVTDLARVLLDTSMSLEIPAAPCPDVRGGCADHHPPRRLLVAGAGESHVGGLQLARPRGSSRPLLSPWCWWGC